LSSEEPLESTGNVLVPDSIDDSAARRAGAVHLFSGRTGALLATLTGGRANDNYDTTALPLANGNYVVLSPSFDYGANPDAGAVTWGSGVTGIAGVVSTTNSLVGASAGDQVGVRVTALTNGNYVVSSEWRDGSGAAVGAATWCDGATGRIGAVTAANSLIGASQVTPLPNGNYVVSNPSWSNGAAAAVGAVTWCNGNTGRFGTISAANSLVGITANDQVGSGLVAALKNGNYVVNSPKWDNGSIVDDGAVTWGNGATGSAGQVSVANSLVGNTNAQILALTNGHYVVSNSYWDNGSVVDVGAVTWCNGTTGRTGRVSAANSLVGTTANGWAAAHTALSNGHYVVQTLTFNNGSATRAGAVTWCNGTTGTTGVVSAANSLVGTTADDYIGYYITPLTNGNYVVSSPYWDNGAVKDAGAVTWCNGASACTGVVSVANSLATRH
jgi:hypothetical protein